MGADGLDGGRPADGAPLHGVRVLDYSQYVAGPLATMLLADLGADVIKVEPPRGDSWRHYAPHGPGRSSYFYSLNRNKRSVVLDLKTARGRADSERLLATADAVVHNLPPERAEAFGLDREAVRRVNPRAVWVCVSAFGSTGADSARLGYDLIAQALAGLLMADVHPADEVPRRSGDIPFADLTTGLLTCVSVLAGLHQRSAGPAPGLEVSLLGAALATQVQRFVRLPAGAEGTGGAVGTGGDGGTGGAGERPGGVTRADLDARARELRQGADLEPYYRCYRTADGHLALACLNPGQRRRVLDLLGFDDPWLDDPQMPPADAAERSRRAALPVRFAEAFRAAPTAHWVALLGSAGVPAGEVRQLDQLFDDEQARRNGLVQSIDQPGVGRVDLLGTVFKVDGAVRPAARPAPDLGEHTAEVLASLPELEPTVGGGRAVE